MRSPLGFHDASQVSGTPLFDPDRFLIKFHNLWTIEAPDGYALLFTHPANRFDLPFTTLTGLVDSDRYHDNFIHFPAHWHDANFSGVLPKGTPIAKQTAANYTLTKADVGFKITIQVTGVANGYISKTKVSSGKVAKRLP